MDIIEDRYGKKGHFHAGLRGLLSSDSPLLYKMLYESIYYKTANIEGCG